MTLEAAASALEAFAAGQVPKRGDVIAGALTLQTLVLGGGADRQLQDAALGLEAVATGRPIELDQVGRSRAADLAKKIREVAGGR
jgi:hypothetical protein